MNPGFTLPANAQFPKSMQSVETPDHFLEQVLNTFLSVSVQKSGELQVPDWVYRLSLVRLRPTETLGLPEEGRWHRVREIRDYIAGSEWHKPCQAMFSHLVATDPDMLLDIIRLREIRPTLLAYAAETVGELVDSEKVASVLVPLLEHEKPYVREGAIYGLGKHLGFSDVRSRIFALSDEKLEPSLGVREAVLEVLEDE